jgi:hypothetical protein
LNLLESCHALLTDSKSISNDAFKLVRPLLSAQLAQAEVRCDHEISEFVEGARARLEAWRKVFAQLAHSPIAGNDVLLLTFLE